MGADVGVTRRLTLAFDFLGTYIIDSPRLVRETFTAANGQSFPQIGFVTDSYNLANGAAGLKFNPGGRLLDRLQRPLQARQRGPARQGDAARRHRIRLLTGGERGV